MYSMNVRLPGAPARPPSRIELLGKFVRRHKALVGRTVATGLALVVGTVFSMLFAFGEARQRHEADLSASDADRARHSALHETYQARLSAAMMALQEINIREAALQLDAAPPGLRGWEWQHLHARVSDLSPISLIAQPEFDEWVTYFPPGKALIARRGHRNLLVDLQRRTVLRDLCDDSSFRGIVNSSPGVLLASARAQGGMTLLDETGIEINIPVTLETTQYLALSRDRKLLAVHPMSKAPMSNEARWLRLFELPSGRLRLTLDVPDGMHRTAFSPDGTLLAGGSSQGVVLWNTTTGTKTVLHGHTARVFIVAFHPDGKRLVSGSLDNTIRQWDLRTGKTIDVRRGHSNAIMGVSYSPDGEWIASGSGDGTVRIWKTDDSQPPTVLPDNEGTVYESRFSPDGLAISTVGDSRNLWWIWPTPAAGNRLVLHGHSSFVYPVVFSPDGRLLASAGWDDDYGICLWDAAQQRARRSPQGPQGADFFSGFQPRQPSPRLAQRRRHTAHLEHRHGRRAGRQAVRSSGVARRAT